MCLGGDWKAFAGKSSAVHVDRDGRGTGNQTHLHRVQQFTLNSREKEQGVQVNDINDRWSE